MEAFDLLALKGFGRPTRRCVSPRGAQLKGFDAVISHRRVQVSEPEDPIRRHTLTDKSARERAIAKPNEGVGMTRYLLYKRAWQRINLAESAGFHLEAIALIESILSDRMESRASYLSGTNIGFKTLERLLKELRARESVSDLLKVLKRIDSWKDQRNISLHEMVKFQEGMFPSWEDKQGPLSRIVTDGKAVLRAFDSIDKRERRRNGARPAATEPAAFEDDDTSHVS